MNKLIGYHGTTIEGADEILKSGKFKVSRREEDWLGEGVYFFEKDKRQAINFCTKARKYAQYSILESKIEADTCLDLDDTVIMETMKNISNKINGRYLTLKDGHTKRKLLNSVILDALYKLEPYDVVKKTFLVEKTTTINRTNLVWVQIQICVRNIHCIKSIEEVERYGG